MKTEKEIYTEITEEIVDIMELNMLRQPGYKKVYHQKAIQDFKEAMNKKIEEIENEQN